MALRSNTKSDSRSRKAVLYYCLATVPECVHAVCLCKAGTEHTLNLRILISQSLIVFLVVTCTYNYILYTAIYEGLNATD